MYLYCFEYKIYLKLYQKYIVTAIFSPQELLYTYVAEATIFGMDKKDEWMQIY